jgi:hypothetical protein
LSLLSLFGCRAASVTGADDPTRQRLESSFFFGEMPAGKLRNIDSVLQVQSVAIKE